MNKPVFNITPPDVSTVHWQQCRLLIEISRHHLHVVVQDEKTRIAVIRLYPLAADTTGDTTVMEEIIKEDDILGIKMKETIIIYNWPESAFVPEALFNINLNKDILDLTYGDVNKGIVFSENIPGWNMYNVYRVPSAIHDLFQQYFPDCRYWHHYSLWMKCRQQRNDRHDRVSVMFYTNELVTAVITSGNLQLMQTAAYQTDDDIVWHILNTYRQFNLDLHKIPLYLSGMIDPDNTVNRRLASCFPVIVSDNTLPMFADAEAAAHYSNISCSPLLNLALCV